MGKKKISIQKIENPSKLQVTFSKRRQGLHRKASDLCRLCDAKVAIISISPSGNPFSYGNPSVDAVVDHYLSGTTPIGNAITNEDKKLISEIEELESELKREKQRGADVKHADLDQLMDIDNFRSLEQLQEVENELMALRASVVRRLEKQSSSQVNHKMTPSFLPGRSPSPDVERDPKMISNCDKVETVATMEEQAEEDGLRLLGIGSAELEKLLEEDWLRMSGTRDAVSDNGELFHSSEMGTIEAELEEDLEWLFDVDSLTF